MGDAENHALPAATNDSWRTWLVTGSRRVPVDRRRLRGAHRGLKKMLMEGMANGGDKPSWKNFSGAMIRHAVDEAMRALPAQDNDLVKLAYFGGLSNREIARSVGMNESTVQRRLSRALDAISDYIERGRSFGRRAFYALMLWLSVRWVGDATHHVVQAAAVMSAAAIIAVHPAVLATHSAPPVNPIPKHAVLGQAAAQHPGAPSQPSPSLTDAATDKAKPPPVSVPQIHLPVQVPPVPVQVPPVPAKLPLH